jgi:hypothetical protein
LEPFFEESGFKNERKRLREAADAPIPPACTALLRESAGSAVDPSFSV